jgi:hypothetical protein
MSTFSVKVRTNDGTRHQFDQLGRTAAEVHEAASERFGHLCNVLVMPK